MYFVHSYVQGAGPKSDTLHTFQKKMPKNIIYHYIQGKFADNGHIYILHQFI